MRRTCLIFGLALMATVVGSEALLGSSAVMAQTDDDQAREIFKKGQEAFKRGDYQSAMREFQAGYALTRKNGFLLNIGICQKKLGNDAGALETFQDGLERETDDAKKAKFQKQVDLLEAKIGITSQPDEVSAALATQPAFISETAEEPEVEEAAEPAPSVAAPAPPPVASPDVTAAPPQDDIALISTSSSAPKRQGPTLLATSVRDTRARDEPDDDSILASPWFWTGTAAVVAGVVVGVLLVSGANSTETGTLGVIDTR